LRQGTNDGPPRYALFSSIRLLAASQTKPSPSAPYSPTPFEEY